MNIENPIRVNAILADIKKSDKDYVTSEDFRGQLGEWCPGIFNYVAKDLGITCKDLQSKLENGDFMKVDLFRIMKGVQNAN